MKNNRGNTVGNGCSSGQLRDSIDYHSQINSCSIVDIAICSSDCQIDFENKVISDLYGSDHYLGKLKLLGNNMIPAKLNKFSI